MISTEAPDIAPATHHNALKQGTCLNWYRIVSILGQGGFGITYLAFDTNLKQKVAIKEYLPHEFSLRGTADTVRPVSLDHKKAYEWGLRRFLEEAQTLAKFKHPDIVRVLSFFEENNTAYMVMEYEEGVDLGSLIKAGEHFSEKRILGILMPILDGLEKMHAAGFIHRDIKPSNIFIRGDGSPVLIDFGSARHAVRGHTRTMTSLVTPGYAPFEQYHDAEGKQGPWTDIYALGATCYCAITGKPPVDALKRGMVQFEHDTDVYLQLADIMSGKYSGQLLEAIDCALRFKDSDRPQSIGEWKKILSGEAEPRPVSSRQERTQPLVPEKPGTAPPVVDAKTVPYRGTTGKRSAGLRTGFQVMVLLLLLLTGGGIYLYLYQPEATRRFDALVADLAAWLPASIEPLRVEPSGGPVAPPEPTAEALLQNDAAMLAKLAQREAEIGLLADLTRLEQEKRVLAEQVRADTDEQLRQRLAQKIADLYRHRDRLERAREKRMLASRALRETDPGRRLQIAQQIVELDAPASAPGGAERSPAELEADLLVSLSGGDSEERFAAELAELESEKRLLENRLERNPDETLRLEAAKKAVEIVFQKRQLEIAREIRLAAAQALQAEGDRELSGLLVRIADLQTRAALALEQRDDRVITEFARREIALRREAEAALRQRNPGAAPGREQTELQAEIARLEAEQQRLAELAKLEAEKTREAELAKQHAQDLLREQLAKFEAEKRRLAAQEQQNAERWRRAEIEQQLALEKAQKELVENIAGEQDFSGLTSPQALQTLQAALAESADETARDIDIAILEDVVRERLAQLHAQAERRAEAERSARSGELLVAGAGFFAEGRLEQALRTFREVYDLNASARDRDIALKGIADTMAALFQAGNTENWQLFTGSATNNLSGRYPGNYTTNMTGGSSDSVAAPTLVAHRGSKLTLAAIGTGIVVIAELDGSRGLVEYHDSERQISARGTIDTNPGSGMLAIDWQSAGGVDGNWRATQRSTLWFIDVGGDYVAEVGNAHTSIFRRRSFDMKLTDQSRIGAIGRPGEIVGLSEDEYIEIRGRKVSTTRVEFEFVSKFSNYRGTGWFDIADNRAKLLQGEWDVPGHHSAMSAGEWTLERSD